MCCCFVAVAAATATAVAVAVAAAVAAAVAVTAAVAAAVAAAAPATAAAVSSACQLAGRLVCLKQHRMHGKCSNGIIVVCIKWESVHCIMQCLSEAVG